MRDNMKSTKGFIYAKKWTRKRKKLSIVSITKSENTRYDFFLVVILNVLILIVCNTPNLKMLNFNFPFLINYL